MFEDGSSLTGKRLPLRQQVDLHSHYLQIGILVGVRGVSAPPAHHVAGGRSPRGMAWHGWLAWEPSCMLMLTRRSWLFFPPWHYGCLSWQIPNGKEVQAGLLLPALSASVVTESPAHGLAVMLPLGGLYLMFLLFKLLYIQLNYMARSDFMADEMDVSQIFLCLLLTRKSYKTHLVT